MLTTFGVFFYFSKKCKNLSKYGEAIPPSDSWRKVMYFLLCLMFMKIKNKIYVYKLVLDSENYFKKTLISYC